MKTISVNELHSILTSGNAPDLIDVRTPAEFAGIHAPAARSLPLESLDCATTLAEHNRSKSGLPLYILCHSGARAKKAAEKFAKAGFENCAVIEGGMQAWAEAGLPVERGPRTVLPLDRQLQVVMGVLVLTGVLLGHYADPRWILISGFVGAGLLVAGVIGICPMRSLIARMPWNQAGPESPSCCGG